MNCGIFADQVGSRASDETMAALETFVNATKAMVGKISVIDFLQAVV